MSGKNQKTHAKDTQSELVHKNQNSKIQNNKIKNKHIDYEQPASFLMIPIFIILCIIPFIVRMKVYDSGLAKYQWFQNEGTYLDFFLYYKQWFFVFTAAIMAVIIIYKISKDREAIKVPAIFLPLAFYAVLALLSAIFSKNASFSYGGGFEQFESVFAVLGYCLAVFYVFLFIKAEKDYQKIIKSLIIVSIILGILGLFQFIGYDFFKSSVGHNLILPSKYRSTQLTMSFAKGMVYLTLYNPNYVGVFASLLLPVLSVMLFFEKRLLWIILNIIAIAGLIICAVGSHSLSGVIGLGTAAFLIVIFMWRYLVKRLYITIPVVLVLVIGFSVLNAKTNNYITSRISNMFTNTKTNDAITDMETNQSNISLTYKGNKMTLQYVINGNNSNPFIPQDKDGNNIACSYDQASNTYVLTDERFNGISFGVADTTGADFYIQESGIKWTFTNQVGDNQYYYINAMNRPDKMINAPSALFTNHEAFASNRGYIWSRTIPLMKKYILLGSGSDTFVLDFPQQDYLKKIQRGYATSIITKPHSLYLQMAVQTGLFSLIAFLVFYGMYFVSSIRLYIRGRFNSYYAKIGIAIFIGTFTYMITGLTNDSSITTAPTFWVLIGMGIAVNYKVKPLIKEELEELKLKQDKETKEPIAEVSKSN